MSRSVLRHSWRADAALVAITAIWGATFVVVKEALNDASTLLFLALRFMLATIALGIAFRPLPGKFTAPRRLLAGAVLAGVCLFGGYALQTFGLRYTSPSKSAFLTGLSIVLVPLLAAMLEKKKPRATELIGVAIATVGMALMTLPSGSFRVEKGDLLTLGCAVAFGLQILVVGHYAPRLGFAPLTLIQIATAAVLALGTFWWVETPAIRWSAGVVIAIVVTGLFATALAFGVQAWAQQYTTPTRTALIFALEPVAAWLTSFVAAGELLSQRGTAGAALILGGILLVELKPSFPLRKRGEHRTIG